MTYDEILILSQAAENCALEFKETTGQLERGMETLCAFLNARGGTVLFGLSDNGRIKGQDVSDKTKRDIVEVFDESSQRWILKFLMFLFPIPINL